MAQPGFWRGLGTAALILISIALCLALDACIGYTCLFSGILTVVHEALNAFHLKLKHSQTVKKTKSIAVLLYPQCDKIQINLLEIAQHSDRATRTVWSARVVVPRQDGEEKVTLVKTPKSALSKEGALRELRMLLAKQTLQKAEETKLVT